LIVPNPESALNEEAGRLLLERYEDYAKQARLYTSIHAKPSKTEPKQKEATSNTAATPASSNPESPTKKRAVAATPATATTATTAAAAKKKTEKKSLKRL
jgi:ubiquitin-conjugating enzyme E2 S